MEHWLAECELSVEMMAMKLGQENVTVDSVEET